MDLRLYRRAIHAIVFLSVLWSCGTKDKAGSPVSTNDPPVNGNGELVYRTYCLSCHLAEGQGAPPMNPPLVKTSFVTGDKTTLIKIILEGMSNVPVDGDRYRNVMPPFDYLSDKDIADVLTYVRTRFGNGGEAIKEKDVKTLRDPAKKSTQ
jgi:mono/diheme cytochrome c family protein